ncbi:hypothetical protein [Rhizobium nepotum]|uniref:Uncharacterized protein n=1 Tax=Rhizobium nepotum 39/7 TaxID=1368418 RepID=A0ABR5CLG3_9HYPH|nr:hypothetical protein [Rhizobium nepotum]KJF65579.1 hypothetical protein RS75_22295 [Rhizobium nepotum 39/7]
MKAKNECTQFTVNFGAMMVSYLCDMSGVSRIDIRDIFRDSGRLRQYTVNVGEEGTAMRDCQPDLSRSNSLRYMWLADGKTNANNDELM